jgi:probable rRNA maturation factor
MPVELRHESATGHADLAADAERLLRHAELDALELSIVLCDDAFIQDLNRTWRDKDEKTDVLSFPMESDALLGDLVISLPTAERQALGLGHTLEQELRVLLVHGFLHLLGYDHIEPADATEMRDAEGRMLRDVLGRDPTGLIERVDPHNDEDTARLPG